MTKAGEIEFMLRPRRGSRPICGSCGKKGATYDHTSFRRFEFVPLWGLAVFFVSPMRRADCCRCGVTTERIPRSCGNHQQTFSYRLFLATRLQVPNGYWSDGGVSERTIVPPWQPTSIAKPLDVPPVRLRP
jgi:hypothetical protein